jgi:hypothetical protein
MVCFCLQFKIKDPDFNCSSELLTRIKACQQLGRSFFPLGFAFDFEVPKNLSRGKSWSSDFPVSEAVTLFSQRRLELLSTIALP